MRVAPLGLIGCSAVYSGGDFQSVGTELALLLEGAQAEISAMLGPMRS